MKDLSRAGYRWCDMILAFTVSDPLSWVGCLEGSGTCASAGDELDVEVVLSKVRYEGAVVLALEPQGRRGSCSICVYTYLLDDLNYLVRG
jgi:hypothetical protein